jgi:hypothetical protein
MPQTLDFVRNCGERWNVRIAWLEYSPEGEKQRKFRVVDHKSASRNGDKPGPGGETLKGGI